jgi:hypothetical protein
MNKDDKLAIVIMICITSLIVIGLILQTIAAALRLAI